MKIIQYIRNNTVKAVVIAHDVTDGYTRLMMHTKVDWSAANAFIICECRNSLIPRVLAMEGSDSKTIEIVKSSIEYRDVLRSSPTWAEKGNAERDWLASMEGVE